MLVCRPVGVGVVGVEQLGWKFFALQKKVLCRLMRGVLARAKTRIIGSRSQETIKY